MERERGLRNIFQNPGDPRVVLKIMKELRADVFLTLLFHYNSVWFVRPKKLLWNAQDAAVAQSRYYQISANALNLITLNMAFVCV